MSLRVLGLRAGAALAVVGLAGACQSTAGRDAAIVTLASADLPPPVSVAVEVPENAAEGVTVNDWGGEIPQSKPVGGVDEGGLGDLP